MTVNSNVEQKFSPETCGAKKRSYYYFLLPGQVVFFIYICCFALMDLTFNIKERIKVLFGTTSRLVKQFFQIQLHEQTGEVKAVLVNRLIKQLYI